ncbi:MAG: hypothetical protein ACYTBJ_21705 [Planctomycetota bacterium]
MVENGIKGDLQKVKIPALAVLPRFTIAPKIIFVRNARPNQPLKKELSISSNYNEQFEVESASSREGAIRLLNQQQAENRCILELEILPPPAEGKRGFSDLFHVNIKDGNQPKVNCHGFCKKTSPQS